MLGVTTALLASGPAAAKPTLAERLEARSICVSERGVGDPFQRREFRVLYGGKRAFRRCVRFHIRQVRVERRLELPMIRSECRLARMEAPLEFRQDYPGGIDQCIRIESMP